MSQAASAKSLHPVLQAALASLDVTVESELERYRTQELELSPATTIAEQINTFVENTSEVTPAVIATNEDATTRPITSVTNSAGTFATASDQLAHSDSPTAATLSTPDFLAEPVSLVTFKQDSRFPNPLDSSSPPVPAESSRFLLPTFNASAAPDDFLASSEALLQLAPPPSQTDHWPHKWLTPWGIAAIAAAVTVTISLLVAGFNLSQNRKKQPESADTVSNAQTSAQLLQPKVAPSSAKIATVPDLSKQEFLDLNLTNLSRVSPTASTSHSPPISQITTTHSTQSIKPQMLHSATRLTVPSAPKVKEIGYFYVVTPYFGETALQQIQAVIPDAFLANFPEGTRVQVGAFNNSQDAQNMVRFLKAKGISVIVRRPAG